MSSKVPVRVVFISTTLLIIRVSVNEFVPLTHERLGASLSIGTTDKF